MKLVGKNAALAGSALANFMAYPVEGEKGSTLGIMQSLWKTGENNLFYDVEEEYAQISQNARYYIGGLIEHAAALSVFTNPTTNSYKRLAAEPRFIGWSKSNRMAGIQVLHNKKNDKAGKRVVYTLSDPSVNPYLAYSAVVAAGIDGIKNKTECGDPSDEEGKKGKAKLLPESLKEAVSALESDSKFLKGVFSAEIIGDYLSMKLSEHRESAKAISGWEMNRYFNV
jgi:glutamine synthetase